MQISIKTNFPDVQRKLDQLQQDVRAKASASAVNKTMEQARTQMIREITSEYTVKAGFVRERLRISKATFRQGAFNIEASLQGTGKISANVIAFSAKQVSTGVSVKIKKAGGRKIITGAFIGNKGRTVFKRVGAKRLPIKAVATINVPQMFNQKRINAAVVAAIKAKFPTIFEREAKFYVARFNGRA